MMNFRNAVIGVIVSGLVAAVVVSCGGGGGGYGGGGGGGSGGAAAPTNTVRSARLTGAAENPAVVTAATGLGAVVVDPTTKAITGGINFQGLTATAQDIFQAPLGDPTGNGSSIIPLNLATDNRTATIPPNTTLTDAQYTALLAGELYFQVRTAGNANGEIRGQINGATGLVAAVANLTGGQEAPPVVTATSGRGTVVVDSSTREIYTGYITHDIATADQAHIHGAAGPGTNGGITVGFNVGTNIATAPAGAVMLQPDFDNLVANYSYFNVHNTPGGNGGGQIRGDIVVQVLP